MLSDMRKLLTITGKGARFAVLLLLRAPFNAFSTIVQAQFLSHAFDAIERSDPALLSAACLFFAVATVCLYLYNGTIWSLYAPFITRMEGTLRRKLFAHIGALPYGTISSTPRGEWITRLNTDVQMPFSQPLHFPHAACAIVDLCVSSLLLWRMNPAVFGLVILFVAPHVAVTQLLIARAMPRLNARALEATAQNTDDLAAFTTCADVAMLYDAQAYQLRAFEKSSLRLKKAKCKIHDRNALAQGILPLFGLGGYLTLLVVSSGWIADGLYTFGDLTAAFQYRGGILLGSMMLINSLISIQGSMAGIRRINATLAERTEASYG